MDEFGDAAARDDPVEAGALEDERQSTERPQERDEPTESGALEDEPPEGGRA